MKHSLIFASVIGIITLLQAYVFTGCWFRKSTSRMIVNIIRLRLHYSVLIN
ncbi:hypothetical protein ACNKHM_17645 [Shigella sonnei]